MARYRWKKIAGFPHTGHSFFQVEDDPTLVSACDQSGERPDRTDDGPLWLDHTRPITGTRDRLSAPVIQDRGARNCFIVAEGKEADWLLRYWMDRGGEVPANERLRIAGPEMLAALKGIQEAAEDFDSKDANALLDSIIRTAKAARKLAEGV